MKEVFKRFLPFVLCALMVCSVLPVTALADESENSIPLLELHEYGEEIIPDESEHPYEEVIGTDEGEIGYAEPNGGGMAETYASSGEVTGLSNENIGLSYSGDKTDTWSASGTTITGSIQSSSGCDTTPYESTLIIKNNRSIPASLSFDYEIGLQGGTILVDGSDVTAGGTFSKEIAAGGTVKVYIKSNSTSAPTKITLNNVALSANIEATATFLPAENGSYTVNGQVVTEEFSNTQNAMNAYKLVATPDSGYQFRGWYNETTGEYLGTDTALTLNVESDCTVTAQFISDDANLFETGTQTFVDLGDAATYAKENGISQITLLSKKATLTQDYTIPAEVTLLVPHDAAKTLFSNSPTALPVGNPNPAVSKKDSEYRRLTLAEGVTLTIEGALSIGGQYRSSSGSSAGYMSGNYGQVWLGSESKIDIKNDGSLYAWGFVSGSGSVVAESGATVHEWYQITDFRGGSATLGMGNKVFPFSQYYVQNIESELVLRQGAKEQVYAAVYASSRINYSMIPFVGDDGMFKVVSGSLTKKYDGASDRIIYTIDGEAEINNLNLSLAGSSVSSKNYVLPLTNNMTVNLSAGSKFTVNQTAALLPGVEANIAEGAEMIISSGNSVYVYDRDEWIANNYTCSGKFSPVKYSPSKAYSRTDADLIDAKVDVNGTLTVNGAVYTTAGGADICSGEGTGIFKQNVAVGTETITYQYTQSGTSVTAHEIPITPAKLHNADGSYTETANAKAGDTISYVEGTWKIPTPEEITITFNANGGEGTMTPQTVSTKDGSTLNANTFTREGYNFTGWNTAADGSGATYADGGAILELKENLTLYAQWQIWNGWTVDANGRQYYRDGELQKSGWTEIDSETYYLDTETGYAATGIAKLVPAGAVEEARCVFDAEGVFQSGVTGVYSVGEDTYWVNGGVIEEYPGLVRTENNGHVHYYYFGEDGKAVKNGNYKVEKNNGLPLPCYSYKFGMDGVIEHDDDTSKNGICDGDGSKFYYIDGVKVGVGLIFIDGNYYYARTSSGEIVRNQSYWVSKTNGLLSEGTYKFDEDGKLLLNGFVDKDGYTYYYKDGALAKGFTKIGDDYYLFNAGSGKMYKDATMWVGSNDYGIMGGMYYFGTDGKMLVPDLEKGVKKIVNENGKLYFTIDGTYMYSGLYELDGEYYYAQGNGELAVNKSIWVSTSELDGNGWYGFGADGKLIKNGFIDGGGYTYYYIDGARAKGFTKIGENYYIFNTGSGKMYKDATMWVGDNEYGITGGMYYFAADGKMFVPDLEKGVKKIVEENGKLYFTVDGVKVVDMICELDGEYYYAQGNGELAVSKSIWVSTSELDGNGWYGFGADGKLIKNGFINGGGYTYYYVDGVRAKGFTKIGEDYYIFNAGSGKMYKDATMWVGSNSYGIKGGMYYFNTEGKMAK